jgi:hypothetical protein
MPGAGGHLFYFDDRVLRSVDTTTLKDRELYRVPAGFKPALPTCTADGRYVAFAYIEETAQSTETGRIYSTMHERFYQHPHSVVRPGIKTPINLSDGAIGQDIGSRNRAAVRNRAHRDDRRD